MHATAGGIKYNINYLFICVQYIKYIIRLMGITQSKDIVGSSKKSNIFSKELDKLEGLVNSVITSDGRFVDNEYNFLDATTCNKYTMVLESSLSKHLKIDLHDLASSIYFVSKDTDNVRLPSGERITKSELCSIITSHYKRTLKMLTLIRQIYDFENGGKFSIAGIIYRNLEQVDGMYQVSACGVEQEPLTEGDARVDFKKLKGLNMFVNEFLTEQEADTFTRHLKQLFGNFNKRYIAKLICEDTIVSPKGYKEIYDDINVQCGGKAQEEDSSLTVKHHGKRRYQKLMFKVTKDRPIISYDLCFDKQKYMVPHGKRIRELFNKFKTDYLNNIDLVYNVVHKLVAYDFTKGAYKLRDLSHEQVTAVEFELKRCVVTLFFQSMVNYFKILNHVKQIKNLKKSDG